MDQLRLDSTTASKVNWYGPTPICALKEINRLLALLRKQYAFIDVGCGKGLALLMAAKAEYLQVIGLEISCLLCGIAKENIKRFRQRTGIVSDIRVLNCDATQFDLPRVPCVLFYNPFKLELMQQKVRNVVGSSAEQPRPVILVFLNPTVIRDFELPPELKKVAEKPSNWRRPGILIYRVG